MFSRARSPYEDHVAKRIFAQIYLVPSLQAGLAPGLPLPMRIWLVGLGRIRPGGHSNFRDGELVSRLPDAGGVLPSRSTVQRAIAKLRDCGLLAPSSSVRCLVFPIDILDMSIASAESCAVCGHAGAWLSGQSCWATGDVFQERAEYRERGSLPPQLLYPTTDNGGARDAPGCRDERDGTTL